MYIYSFILIDCSIQVCNIHNIDNLTIEYSINTSL